MIGSCIPAQRTLADGGYPDETEDRILDLMITRPEKDIHYYDKRLSLYPKSIERQGTLNFPHFEGNPRRPLNFVRVLQKGDKVLLIVSSSRIIVVSLSLCKILDSGLIKRSFFFFLIFLFSSLCCYITILRIKL